MRRKLLLVVLGLGSVLGFAAGAASWRHHGQWGAWRSGPYGGRFDGVAEACVRAAERVRQVDAPPAATTPPAP
jgi:hypothetical protein